MATPPPQPELFSDLVEWTRYWAPVAGEIQLLSDFLTPPERWNGRVNSSLVSTSELQSSPCIILLGEGGMGKSVELERLRDCERSDRPDDAELHLKLRQFGSETRLDQRLWKAPQLERWAGSDNETLRLYLDGLDECVLELPGFAISFGDEFAARHAALPRLRLRITCRSGFLPSELVRSLKQLWPELKIVKLAPLTHDDVRQFCDMFGVDARSFFHDISKQGVGPFAARPVTLSAMVRMYRDDHALPRTRWELYEQLTLTLARDCCERPCVLEADARQDLAGQLCFMALFAGRRGIAAEDDCGDEWLRPAEVRSRRSVEPSRRAVQDAISTGLFTVDGGDNTVSWAHQTYAEFLAARYLYTRVQHHDLSEASLVDLFRHPEDPQRIIPKLSSVASWLVPRLPRLFELVADSRPDALLDGDPAELSVEQRLRGIAGLLSLVEAEHSGYDFVWRVQLDHFSEPAAEQLLRDALSDSELENGTRRLALRLLRPILTTGRISEWFELLTNQHLSLELRVAIVTEIRYQLIVDDEADVALPDVTAVLDAGIPLRALTELLLLLFDSRVAQLDGHALFERLPTDIDDDEDATCVRNLLLELSNRFDTSRWIDAALDWLSNVNAATMQRLEYAVGEVLATALEHIHGRERALGRVLALRHQFGIHDLFARHQIPQSRREHLFADETTRRTLFIEMLNAVHESTLALDADLSQRLPRRLVGTVVWHQPRLLTLDDVDWAIERHRSSDVSSPLRGVWTYVIRAFTAIPIPRDSPQFIAARDYALAVEDVAQAAPWLLREHDLPQSEAHSFATDDDIENQWNLQSAVSGAESAWERWRSALLFLLGRDSSEATELWTLPTPAVRDLDRWGQLSEAERVLALSTARGFLHEIDPPALDFFDGRYADDFSAHAAVLLLIGEGHDIGTPIVHRWLPRLLATCCWLRHADSTPKVLQLLMQHEQTAVIDIIEERLKIDDHSVRTLFRPELLLAHWTPRLSMVIARALKSRWVSGELFDECLRTLFERQPGTSTETLACSYLSTTTQHSLIAASRLLLHAGDVGWELVDIASCRYACATSLLERVAERMMYEPPFYGPESVRLPNALSTENIAELLLALERYCPASLSNHRDVGFHLYDSTRRVLQQRSALEQEQALQRLVVESNQSHYRTWLDAIGARVLNERWQPPSPSQLVALMMDGERRLVQTAAQLRSCVAQTISGEIQSLLRNRTAEAPLLWNSWKTKDDDGKDVTRYDPKGETLLSDYVANRLRELLPRQVVAAHREVEWVNPPGPGIGERTDIIITAPLEGLRTAQPEIVVEVKCNWNGELLTAIPDQLVAKYLQHSSVRHGVYLVGWFYGSKWDSQTPATSRQQRVRQGGRGDLAAVLNRLRAQAVALREHGYFVDVVVLQIPLDPREDGELAFADSHVEETLALRST